MARIRKIKRVPDDGKNYYVVDACFLANRFIPEDRAPDAHGKKRIRLCNEWWDEIDKQLSEGTARVYIPDICVAEAYKTLAKKYYSEGWFKSSQDYNYWRSKMKEAISTSVEELKKAHRKILYHDLESTRDVMISVDRFYELFFKNKKNVSLPDLIVVASAKYLVDFYDIPKTQLHIITMDRALRDGSKRIQQVPNAYDPTVEADAREKVFE